MRNSTFRFNSSGLIVSLVWGKRKGWINIPRLQAWEKTFAWDKLSMLGKEPANEFRFGECPFGDNRCPARGGRSDAVDSLSELSSSDTENGSNMRELDRPPFAGVLAVLSFRG